MGSIAYIVISARGRTHQTHGLPTSRSPASNIDYWWLWRNSNCMISFIWHHSGVSMVVAHELAPGHLQLSWWRISGMSQRNGSSCCDKSKRVCNSIFEVNAIFISHYINQSVTIIYFWVLVAGINLRMRPGNGRRTTLHCNVEACQINSVYYIYQLNKFCATWWRFNIKILVV